MKAAVLLAPEDLIMKDVEVPKIGADEVLFQPKQIGICGSDVTFYLGHRPVPYPFILGHEVVGHIVAVGAAVTKFKPGQRIIVEPNYSCGNCALCRIGRGNICPNKKSLGVNVPGCFSEFATAPAEFVWALPDNISDDDAATIEPQAVSVHALLVSGAKLGDTVAVVGCGVIGLLLIHAAVKQGVRVLAHDKFPRKLEMAERLGATVIEADDTAQLWHQEGVSTIYECAGVPASIELSLNAAPRGSQVVMLGITTNPASFVPIKIVREGIHIIPSLIYDHPGDFARTIRLVSNGTLTPSKIITDTVPFESLKRALQIACTGQSAKVITRLP
jgi:2-desacetyl-2-hydroxyethyl bacteriochlorophyllide A dehydrogenase